MRIEHRQDCDGEGMGGEWGFDHGAGDHIDDAEKRGDDFESGSILEWATLSESLLLLAAITRSGDRDEI